MRVLIDTTYAQREPQTGTGVYIARLCDALSATGAVELRAEANQRRRHPAGGGAGSVRNGAVDLWWTEVELPRLAQRHHADLIHHPLPARAHATRLPQVITIHDLAFERLPDAFDRRFRTYAHLVHRDAARHAEAVIAVSHTTAADAQALWSVPAGRIVVASHGPGQAESGSSSGPVGEAAASPPHHYLYVGDDEPRKDLPTLLCAYALYRRDVPNPLPLILAGTARAQAPGVQHVRSPAPERLRDLITHAAALVHPARYEGFGLTALEAMALGTPVIAARSPALVELCGDAARYFPPGDGAALAVLLAEPPALRSATAAAGRARAAQFSWSQSAERHLDAYSLALSQ